jgi:hypothetical protein
VTIQSAGARMAGCAERKTKTPSREKTYWEETT